MKRTFVVLLVALGVLAGTALLVGPDQAIAVTLYASTGDDNVVGGGLIYKIDTVTGAVTLVGDTGLSRLDGIDFNSTGVLYGVDGGGTGPSSGLYTIDPTTAVAAFIGPIEGILGIGALRFAPGGTLYGGGWDGTSGRLITIDPASGRL